MHLSVPAHDCFVSGLGMYGEHHAHNPLTGGLGAEALLDEHIRFYFQREEDNPELNLKQGIHFPIVIGQKRERKETIFKKPAAMKELFIAIQHGCQPLFIALTEKESGGMYIVQLKVCVAREVAPRQPIMLPPVPLHRYIKST